MRLAVLEITSSASKPKGSKRREHGRQAFTKAGVIVRIARVPRSGTDTLLVHGQGCEGAADRPAPDTLARPSGVLTGGAPFHAGARPIRRAPTGFCIASSAVLNHEGDEAADMASGDVKRVWNHLGGSAPRAPAPSPTAATPHSVGVEAPGTAADIPAADPEAIAALLRAVARFAAQLRRGADDPVLEADARSFALWEASTGMRDGGILDALAAAAREDARLLPLARAVFRELLPLARAVPRELLPHLSCKWLENQTFVRFLAKRVRAPPGRDTMGEAVACRLSFPAAWRSVRDARTGVALLAATHIVMAEGLVAVAEGKLSASDLDEISSKLTGDLRKHRAVSWVAACRDTSCCDATNNAAEGQFSLIKMAARRNCRLRHPAVALARVIGGPQGFFTGSTSAAEQCMPRTERRLKRKHGFLKLRKPPIRTANRGYRRHPTQTSGVEVMQVVRWSVVMVRGGAVPARDFLVRLEPCGGVNLVDLAQRSCSCDVQSALEHRRWTCKHRMVGGGGLSFRRSGAACPQGRAGRGRRAGRRVRSHAEGVQAADQGRRGIGGPDPRGQRQHWEAGMTEATPANPTTVVATTLAWSAGRGRTTATMATRGIPSGTWTQAAPWCSSSFAQ